MGKILIVDDEQSIRQLIKMTLALENYQVMEASDGEAAYNLIIAETFDLILLDIMLPKISGTELLEKISHLEVPVILLTAKTGVQDKVSGLKLGAEDYITKPFEPLELLARIEVILRRATMYNQKNDNIILDNIKVIKSSRKVFLNDLPVALTPKEFDLLVVFLENLDTVMTRDDLLDEVWGFDYYGETRTVDVHINQLREKLILKDKLKTIFKVGYRLNSI